MFPEFHVKFLVKWRPAISENFFGKSLIQCFKQKIRNYMKGITVQFVKHILSKVRVRHHLPAERDAGARIQAQRLQVHPEMLLLESGVPGRAHAFHGQGDCDGGKRRHRSREDPWTPPTGIPG